MPAGRYEAAVTTSAPGPSRTQARRRFATLKEARAFVARARTQVGLGTFQQRTDMTLSQLGALWLASKSRPRQSTRDGYAGDLRRTFGDHRDRPVQQLTSAELQGWVDSWPAGGGANGKGLSRRSVQVNVQRLRQVPAHGVKLGIIRANPAEDLEVPALTLEEENATRKRRTDGRVDIRPASAVRPSCRPRRSCGGLAPALLPSFRRDIEPNGERLLARQPTLGPDQARSALRPG